MKGSHIQMIVQFVNRQSKYKTGPWQNLLRLTLPAAFTSLDLAGDLADESVEAQVTVTFAGPLVMRRLNREIRSVDRITDVLSFPLLQMTCGKPDQPLQAADFDLSEPERRILPLGDLVISLDRAFAQAAEYQHSEQREIAFLAVHGLLHLLGFDHEGDNQEKVMLQMQENILQQLGLRREQRQEDLQND